LLEAAGARYAKFKARRANSAERRCDVFRRRGIDLPDEAKRQVQLLLVLPAEVGAVVHRVDQEVADGLGRPDGDKQARHDSELLQFGRKWQFSVNEMNWWRLP
jgi:hypothetical protein